MDLYWTGCAGCSNRDSDLPRTAPKLPRMVLSTQSSLPEGLEITTPTIRQQTSNPWKSERMCAWSNHVIRGMGHMRCDICPIVPVVSHASTVGRNG